MTSRKRWAEPTLDKEPHAFRRGSESYGQTPDECFYCWRTEAEHDEQPLELHGLLL